MRSTSYRFHILAALLAGTLVSHTTHAGNVSGLTEFKDKTAANAAEVNGNFTKIQDAVNDNNTRIGTLNTDNTTNTGNISALQARLDTLETQILGVLTFPHILTATNSIAIAAGPGVVSYAGGDKAIVGAKLLTLPAFTMNTAANKIYHIRMEAGVWKLIDVTGSILPETDPSFDSRSDSMLVARVVADSGNTAKADALINRDRLQFGMTSFVGCVNLPPKDDISYNFIADGQSVGQMQSHQRSFKYGTNNYFYMNENVVLNWARTPQTFSYSNNQGHFSSLAGNRNYRAQVNVNTRYNMVGGAEWVLDNPANCLDISVVMSGSN